jgi:hypothetical protein
MARARAIVDELKARGREVAPQNDAEWRVTFEDFPDEASVLQAFEAELDEIDGGWNSHINAPARITFRLPRRPAGLLGGGCFSRLLRLRKKGGGEPTFGSFGTR